MCVTRDHDIPVTFLLTKLKVGRSPEPRDGFCFISRFFGLFQWQVGSSKIHYSFDIQYPPYIKRSNDKSPINGGSKRKIIYRGVLSISTFEYRGVALLAGNFYSTTYPGQHVGQCEHGKNHPISLSFGAFHKWLYPKWLLYFMENPVSGR